MLKPQPSEVNDAFNTIFKSSATIDALRARAVADRLLPQSIYEDGLPGRSLAWKLFVFPGPPLSTPVSPARLLDELREIRREYVELLSDKMRAPDGGYEDGFVLPGPGQNQPVKRVKVALGWETNNPLSLDDQNPWREWFAALELRKTIAQDVDRTYPEMEYFRSPKVQATLTNILFVQALTLPDIGYRQGMHELLAPILQAVQFDALPKDSPSTPADLAAICDSDWAEADAWALFRVVMSRISIWYEWRDEGPQTTFSPNTGALEIKPHVAPIVAVCGRIHNELVRSVDPELHSALQRGGVEPQIYGIRWLRLLFTREFGMHDALRLWDGLYAYTDDLFDLAQWVCVAMLLRIRNDLIPGDYTTQLTRLLRYPSAPAPTSPTSPVKFSHTLILLRQAIALRSDPTPSTGASVVGENWNLLGIPTMVPAPDSPKIRRRRGSLDTSTAPRPKEHLHTPTSPKRPSPSPAAGPQSPAAAAAAAASYVGALPTPGSIANRIYDTGESLGINRYLFSTVSEIRRNLPDIAGTLTRTASMSSAADLNTFSTTTASPVTDFSAIQRRNPSMISGLPTSSSASERPPWEPKTRYEMEKEVTDVRALQKRLGQSVGWAVDVLLADVVKRSEEDQSGTREALEALSYVRDLLVAASTGSVEELDEERLFGETEMARRKAAEAMERHAREESERARARAEEAAKAPAPAPPAPSRPPVAASARPLLSSRDFRGPTPNLPRAAVQPAVSPKLQRSAPGSGTTSTTALSFPPSRRTGSPVPATNDTDKQLAAKQRQAAPWTHTHTDFSAPAPGVAPPSSVVRASPRQNVWDLPSAYDSPDSAGGGYPLSPAASGYPPSASFGYPPASTKANDPASRVVHDPLGALQ